MIPASKSMRKRAHCRPQVFPIDADRSHVGDKRNSLAIRNVLAIDGNRNECHKHIGKGFSTDGADSCTATSCSATCAVWQVDDTCTRMIVTHAAPRVCSIQHQDILRWHVATPTCCICCTVAYRRLDASLHKHVITPNIVGGMGGDGNAC